MSGIEARLRERIAEFDALIAQQAQRRIQAVWSERRAALAGALVACGVSEPPVARFCEVWEDVEHGLLPPKLLGELVVGHGEGRLVVPIEAAVGAFHDNAKDDQIFELCMLRAEAYQELEGGGDGHVLERMAELSEMIATGTVHFED